MDSTNHAFAIASAFLDTDISLSGEYLQEPLVIHSLKLPVVLSIRVAGRHLSVRSPSPGDPRIQVTYFQVHRLTPLAQAKREAEHRYKICVDALTRRWPCQTKKK